MEPGIGVCNIAEVQKPVEHRRRRVRADFFDSPVITTKSEYQMHVWSCNIRRVVEELIRRFSDGDSAPFKGIPSLTPEEGRSQGRASGAFAHIVDLVPRIS